MPTIATFCPFHFGAEEWAIPRPAAEMQGRGKREELQVVRTLGAPSVLAMLRNVIAIDVVHDEGRLARHADLHVRAGERGVPLVVGAVAGRIGAGRTPGPGGVRERELKIHWIQFIAALGHNVRAFVRGHRYPSEHGPTMLLIARRYVDGVNFDVSGIAGNEVDRLKVIIAQRRQRESQQQQCQQTVTRAKT